MKSEYNRLRSFTNKFPHDVPFALDLAKFGFFCLDDHDWVRCAFCGVKIGDFKSTNSVYEKHKKAAPYCPFILGLPVGNRPIDFQRVIDNQPIHMLPNYASIKGEEHEAGKIVIQTHVGPDPYGSS